MKLALLIAGYLRSFKENITAIKTHILDLSGVDVVDIYIHVTKNSEKKYLNDTFKLDEIYTHFNPKIIIVSENLRFGDTAHSNLYNQHYKYWILNQQRQEIERVEGIQYDLVMKLRPDVNLQDNIPFHLADNDHICIPTDTKIDKTKLSHPDDPYLCDIIAYGPPNQMDRYFDIYVKLDRLISTHGPVNETLLYHHLTAANIPYKLVDIRYIVILSMINTIAITGDSGCGKTNLSNILKRRLFDNNSAFVLECDRYHKWERGHEKWQTITHLNPDANYIAKMSDDVFDLKLGRDIYQIDYDHQTGKFTDKQIIENKENIIVCGLHTLYLSDHILNLKIFIDAADNIRIPWKIKRDVAKRGHSIPDILRAIEARRADYREFIYPQREKADIVVAFYGDTPFDPATFDIAAEVKFQYKIGIHRKYPLDQVLRRGMVAVQRIDTTDPVFYWLSFEGGVENFEDVMIKTILSFFAI